MDVLPLLTAKVYAVFAFLLGLSLVIRSNVWSSFVFDLRSQRYGFLAIALVALPFALLIVNTHQIWAWTPTVLVTLAGWCMLIKHTIYLLFPHWWPSALRPSTEAGLEKLYKISGYFMIIIGAILIYYTYIKVSPIYGSGVFLLELN